MNKATTKLRKKVRESRRNATEIKEIAKKAQLDMAATGMTGKKRELTALRAFGEIINIAERMDARTGTIDPSAKEAKP